MQLAILYEAACFVYQSSLLLITLQYTYVCSTEVEVDILMHIVMCS